MKNQVHHVLGLVLFIVLATVIHTEAFPQGDHHIVQLRPRQDDGEEGGSPQTLVGVGNLVATIFKGIADLPITTINAVLKPFAPTPAATKAAAAAATPAKQATPQQQQAAQAQPQQQYQGPQVQQIAGLGQPLPGFSFPAETAPPATTPPSDNGEAATVDPESEDEDGDGEATAAKAAPQQQVGAGITTATEASVGVETTPSATPTEEDGDDEADDRVEVSL